MARIVIIDNNQQVCVILRVILEKAGHEVIEATNRASLSACVDPAPGVVIYDPFPPDHEMLQAVRTLRETRGAKILDTGGGEIWNGQHLISEQLEADASLPKPFGAAALLGVIAALQKGGSHQAEKECRLSQTYAE